MSLFETILEANKKGIEVRINPFLIENKGIEELNKLRISLMKGNMPKSLWTNGEFNPK